MTKKCREGILPFKEVATDEPLVARGGLVLPYKLPKAIDVELPPLGSGKRYKLPRFVISLVLMLHGKGKKLEDLRELMEMKEFPASCTVGDGKGLSGLAKANRRLLVEVLKRESRKEYTLDTDATAIALGDKIDNVNV